jgi:HK97 family phage major capsid protein
MNERADLVAEANGIFAAAEAEGRDLTDEEKARDDKINARLQTVAGEIEREERRREWERQVAALPDGNVQAHVTTLGPRSEEDPRRGFANMADFALSVRNASRPGGVVDPRLRIPEAERRADYQAAPTNFHRESGSDEGYMVPPAMRADIWELVTGTQDLANLINAEPTSSNSVELLADESTPWGATGVQAYWRAEAAQMSASKLATKAEQVRLHELYAFVLATEELLQDAPRLNDRLTRGAARAISWKTSVAIHSGTGAGQPLGFMKSAALVSVAKEANQAADTIVAGNVAKMYSRLLPGSAGSAFWLIAPDAFPQLPLMTIGDQPVWHADFHTAPGGVLLGRPVYPSFHCETVGDKGDIVLVAADGYYLARRTDAPQFASSIHLYFDYNVQAFRWTFRIGGQPFLSAAVQPAKGSSALSHFVTLDARA